MKLSEVIRRQCVRAGAAYDDKAMALCDIAALTRQSGLCRGASEEAILEALQEREAIGSTAIGGGVAIPHCRLRGVDDFVVGAISVPDGVDFDASDRRKVYLLVFIITPPEQTNMHLRLLSQISQQLAGAETVRKLADADSDNALADQLLQEAGDDIAIYEPGRKNLISVFVQDQKVFERILAVLAGFEGNFLTVLDAHNSRAFLKTAAQTAEPADSRFCRGILAVVERRLTNEMIRRIEGITGSLAECIGAMVMVQELPYCCGSLEA